MKKKVLISLTAVVLIAVPLAANAANVKQLIAESTNIKLFVNSSQVNKQVVTIEGSSYLPVRALGDALGLSVNWNEEENSIYLTSKAKDEVTAENESLKRKVTELEKKLNSYTSILPYNVDTYDYISPIVKPNYDSDYINTFENFWNQKTPFRVKGITYDSTAFGISFKQNNNSNNNYVSLTFDNSEGKYSEVIWYTAIDDTSDYQFASAIVGQTPSGTNKLITDCTEVYQKDTGFTKYTANVSGLKSLTFFVIPHGQSGAPEIQVQDSKTVPISISSRKTYESYVLVMGMYAK